MIRLESSTNLLQILYDNMKGKDCLYEVSIQLIESNQEVTFNADLWSASNTMINRQVRLVELIY